MKPAISIDIGTYLTKTTEVTHSRGVFRILSLKYFRTPYDNSGIIDEDVFFESLHKNVSLQKLKAADVGVSVPSTFVNYAVFDLPPMSRSDFDKAVVNEARRVIRPVPAEEDIVRYVTLKEHKSKGAGQLSILAAAAMRREVFKYFSFFTNRGITPDSIGSTASNLAAYAAGYLPEASRDWCFIDIGYANTTLVIFSNNKLSLVRNILFASRDFVQAIAKHEHINEAEAEAKFLKNESQDSVSGSWSYLVSEIRRSFAYYKEISGGKIIDSIWFSGGIFKIEVYADLLKKKLGGKINLFNMNALKNVSMDNLPSQELTGTGAVFANALGMALSMHSRQPALNFLPSEARKEKKIRQFRIFSGNILGVAAAFLLVVFFVLFVRLQFLNRSLSVIKSKFSKSEYDTVMKAEKNIDTLNKQIKIQEAFVKKMQEVSSSKTKSLEIIAKYIPSNTALETFEFSSESSSSESGRRRRSASQAKEGQDFKNIKLSGVIDATLEDAVDQLKLFTEKLSRSGVFAEVILRRPGSEEEPLYLQSDNFTGKKKRKFEIELELK
ncbi:MAG: pilus assembly protein PilM [Candidatus Omnitrophica bacterium]|nr:pilus assembly protein PilM [Candidatus Omnitrophota bacterium]MDD5429271.1 pilus assembly protein PilM [Candidatus Omnitrophota bacterium]